jgi:LysM repeat protein
MATITIKRGDTLSQIAEETGIDIPTIQELNPDITDPNVIQEGQTIKLPEADQAMEAAQDPNVELEVTEEDIPDVISAEDFEVDLSEEMAEQERIRARIQKDLEPTTLERDVQQELLDVRERADEIEMEQKEELLELERGGIGTMAGFVAAGEALSQRDALKLEALQREESNLLERLGLRQEAREHRLKSNEQLLQNTQDRINMAFTIQDRIQQQRDRQEAREENLSNRQKANLEDMVNLISGVNPQELEPETQSQLANLSARAGIPFDVVMSRLELGYNQRIADIADGEKTLTTIGNEALNSILVDSQDENGMIDPNDFFKRAAEQGVDQETAVPYLNNAVEGASVVELRSIAEKAYAEAQPETPQEQAILNFATLSKSNGFTEDAAKDRIASLIADSAGIKISSTSSAFDQIKDKMPDVADLIDQAVWLVYNPEDERKGGFLGIGGTSRSEIERKFQEGIDLTK